MSFELIPGRSLGPFRLGSAVSDVVNYMQMNGMVYRSIQVQFNRLKPCRTDICLVSPGSGIRLRFDGASQRLKLIDVYDCTKATLNYGGRLLCGRTAPPSFSLVTRVLGPTFPGKCDRRKGAYLLQYPGVCALFPHDAGGRRRGGESLSIERLGETNPTASRFFVHIGKACYERLPLPQIPASDPYFEPVVVRVGRGIRFARRKRSILLGRHTAQHVMGALGSPDKVFTKDTDSLRIHRGGAGSERTLRGDFFLNYFRLGLDVLVHGTTHRILKIILHTNMPTSRNFNRYRRCNFQIVVDHVAKSADAKAAGPSPRSPPGGLIPMPDIASADARSAEKPDRKMSAGGAAAVDVASAIDAFEVKPQSQRGRPEQSLISYQTTWRDVQSILGKCGRPLVYSGAPSVADSPTEATAGDCAEPRDPNGRRARPASAGSTVLGGATELSRLNPFKPSLFYAYNGVIFEVLPTGHLASVALFDQDDDT